MYFLFDFQPRFIQRKNYVYTHTHTQPPTLSRKDVEFRKIFPTAREAQRGNSPRFLIIAVWNAGSIRFTNNSYTHSDKKQTHFVPPRT